MNAPLLSTTLNVSILIHLLVIPAAAELNLGPVEYVATDSAYIKVPGYSVPSFDYWDGDGLMDLIVGEGGGGTPDGKVRVYLNAGTTSSPFFTDYFYAKADGIDLVCPGSG